MQPDYRMTLLAARIPLRVARCVVVGPGDCGVPSLLVVDCGGFLDSHLYG